MPNIGLCGAHRTGKTTLAAHAAQAIGLEQVVTSTSAVFKQFGLDPAAPMDFSQRLQIQHQVLDAALQAWQGKQDFISDRTPLDFIAYTVADIQGKTEVNIKALNDYIVRCFSVCNSTFSHLLLVQPGIPLVYESGKAALNPAYIEHLNYLFKGLSIDTRLNCAITVIPREMLDMRERVEQVRESCKDGSKINSI